MERFNDLLNRASSIIESAWTPEEDKEVEILRKSKLIHDGEIFKVYTLDRALALLSIKREERSKKIMSLTTEIKKNVDEIEYIDKNKNDLATLAAIYDFNKPFYLSIFDDLDNREEEDYF